MHTRPITHNKPTSINKYILQPFNLPHNSNNLATVAKQQNHAHKSCNPYLQPKHHHTLVHVRPMQANMPIPCSSLAMWQQCTSILARSQTCITIVDIQFTLQPIQCIKMQQSTQNHLHHEPAANTFSKHVNNSNLHKPNEPQHYRSLHYPCNTNGPAHSMLTSDPAANY